MLELGLDLENFVYTLFVAKELSNQYRVLQVTLRSTTERLKCLYGKIASLISMYEVRWWCIDRVAVIMELMYAKWSRLAQTNFELCRAYTLSFNDIAHFRCLYSHHTAKTFLKMVTNRVSMAMTRRRRLNLCSGKTQPLPNRRNTNESK